MLKNIFSKDFINNPTKKTLILFGVLFFIGTGLLVLAMTDLFSESIFKKENSMMLMLIAINTGLMAKIFLRYAENKRKQQ